MRSRTVVAAVGAAGSIALLWAPYFRSFDGGPIHLIDGDAPGFVALWSARAAVALVVLAAVLTAAARLRAATAASVLAVLATLGAGVVPAWRVPPTATCAWVSYDGVPSEPCGPIGFARTPTWGWGLALLLAVAAATAPMWPLRRRPSGRTQAIVTASLAAAILLVASYGPVFHTPRSFARRYADYLAIGRPPSLNAWHGGFAPAGLALLVLAALAIAARHTSAVVFSALAMAAIAIAGVDRPTYPYPASLGWGYWAMLSGAAIVLVVAISPRFPGAGRLVAAPGLA